MSFPVRLCARQSTASRLSDPTLLSVRKPLYGASASDTDARSWIMVLISPSLGAGHETESGCARQAASICTSVRADFIDVPPLSCSPFSWRPYASTLL